MVGACALCCVIIVIARQICHSRKRNRASFDHSSPSDAKDKKDKKKKKKGKGHYNHAYTQSIEMGNVNDDEADGNLRKGTGDNKHKRSSSHRNRDRDHQRLRSRNDIIDGQILTVPMRDGRGDGTNRQHTNSFNSNMRNIAAGI